MSHKPRILPVSSRRIPMISQPNLPGIPSLVSNDAGNQHGVDAVDIASGDVLEDFHYLYGEAC
jgi:hypothetical protein